MPQRFNVLENLRRRLIILDDNALIAEWMKRLQAAPLKVRPIMIVRLQVQRIARNQREHRAIAIHRMAAEHPARRDLAQRR